MPSSSSSFLPPLIGELPHGQQLVLKFCTILNWKESLYKIAEFRNPISSQHPEWRQQTPCYSSHDLAATLGQRLGRS